MHRPDSPELEFGEILLICKSDENVFGVEQYSGERSLEPEARNQSVNQSVWACVMRELPNKSELQVGGKSVGLFLRKC